MKKLLIVCLMATSSSLFAQNIDLSDIESVLSKKSLDSIDNLLLPRGFQKAWVQGGAPVNGLQAKEVWYFRSDPNHESTITAVFSRFIDTSGKAFFRLETSNPFFYAYLMNQLAENNYSYWGTVPKEKEANLVFSNNRYEILIRISDERKVKQYYQYQINIGDAVSEIGYFKPRKAMVNKVATKKKVAPKAATRSTVK